MYTDKPIVSVFLSRFEFNIRYELKKHYLQNIWFQFKCCAEIFLLIVFRLWKSKRKSFKQMTEIYVYRMPYALKIVNSTNILEWFSYHTSIHTCMPHSGLQFFVIIAMFHAHCFLNESDDRIKFTHKNKNKNEYNNNNKTIFYMYRSTSHTKYQINIEINC